MASPPRAFVHTSLLVVKPEAVEPFRARMARHAVNSRTEPGCLVFESHQDNARPTDFMQYEVYTSEDAFKAHQQTPHFKAFRADVDGWVTSRTWWFWDRFTSD